jgi:gas vesicle protein
MSRTELTRKLPRGIINVKFRMWHSWTQTAKAVALSKGGSLWDTTMNKNTAAANAATVFIGGALLGAVVALLFAPQSGRKTRRYIHQLGEGAGNKAEAVQLELRHSIDNIIEEVTEKLQEGLDRGVDWTDSKIADFQRTLESARKSIAEGIEKIQST